MWAGGGWVPAGMGHGTAGCRCRGCKLRTGVRAPKARAKAGRQLARRGRRPHGTRRVLTRGPNAWSDTPPTPPADPMGTRSDPSSPSPPPCAGPCPGAWPPPVPNSPFSASKAGRRQVCAPAPMTRGCACWLDRSPCGCLATLELCPARRCVDARRPLNARMAQPTCCTRPATPDQGRESGTSAELATEER